jgi:hypothetical protein
MLDRPPADRRQAATPGARRARESRARRGKGLASLRVVVHKRRLTAALRAAGRLGEDCPAVDVLEAAAREVLADFTDRWLGPPGKKERARYAR